MKITHKLFIIYSIVFFITTIICGVLVYNQMKYIAINEAQAKSDIILNRTFAIHEYIAEELRPAVNEKLKEYKQDKNYFDPRWMSAGYISRGVDRYFQKKETDQYYYKMFAINARSASSEADAYERKIFTKMKNNKELKLIKTIRYIDEKPYFVLMKKNVYFKSYCMKCHSEPTKAPAGLIDFYGDSRGFHRQNNDLSAVLSIRIPLETPLVQAKNMTFQLMGGLSLLYLISIFILFQAFRRYVATPLQYLGQTMNDISKDESLLGKQLNKQNSLEMDSLATAFNHMSSSLKGHNNLLLELVDERTAALNDSKEQLENILSDQLELLCRTDQNTNIIFANKAFLQYFNIKDICTPGNLLEILSDNFQIDIETIIFNLKPESDHTSIESHHVFQDEDERWLQWNVRGFFTGESLTAIQFLGIDITDKFHKDQLTQKILKEKELLIGEMNHRIKNNLNLINSMIGLKMEEMENSQEQKILLDVQSRIETVSSLHDQLYHTKQYNKVNLNLYMGQVIKKVCESMSQDHISIQHHIVNCDIPTKFAISIGLIVTELVTNSFKYGFKNQQSGNIQIDIVQEQKHFNILFSDSGKGLPENFLKNTKGFGMQMIEILIDQYNGSLNIENDNGAKFHIQLNPI